MNLPLSYLFFFLTLISGTLLSISSSSWFGAWIGLELNLISFIPLITIKINSYFSEAAIKYFLIQALASAFIIISRCLYMSFTLLSSALISVALLLKLGAAPCHFWFPQVIQGLSWIQVIILISIQKLAPIFLISYLMTSPALVQIIILSAILSAFIGAVGGLNLIRLRKIIAFSSINHISWILISISLNDIIWILYFSLYVVISSSVIGLFHSLQASNIPDLLNSNHLTSILTLVVPLRLLSLGGLPPFTGFVPKWIVIQIIVINKIFIPLFFLLLSALITLYFYLRILIPYILLLNPVLTFHTKSPASYSTLFIPLIFFNSLGILTPAAFTLL